MTTSPARTEPRVDEATARDAIRQSSIARLANALPPLLASVPLALRWQTELPPSLALLLAMATLFATTVAMRQWLYRRRVAAPHGGQTPHGMFVHFAATAGNGALLGTMLWLALAGPVDVHSALVAAVVTFSVTAAANWRVLRLRTFACYVGTAVAAPGLMLLTSPAPQARAAGIACLAATVGWALYARLMQRQAVTRRALQRELDAARAEADASRRRLEAALGKLGSGFALYDAEDRLVIANPDYAKLIGLDPAWCVPGTPYRELLERWVSARQLPAAEAERFIAAQLARHRVDGSRVDLPMEGARTVRVSKHLTAEQEVVALLTDLTDETARERELQAAHARAAEAVERLTASIDAHRDAFSFWTAEGRLIAGNDAFRRLFHHAPSVMRPGGHWRDAIIEYFNAVQPYPVESEAFAARYRLLMRLIEQPGTDEEVPVHPDRWLRLSSHPTPRGDLMISASDITHLKRQALELQAAHDATRQSLQLLQDALEATSDAFSIWSADDRLERFNDAFRASSRHAPGQLQSGVGFADFLETMHDAVRDRVVPGHWPARRALLLKMMADPPASATVTTWPDRWVRVATQRTASGHKVLTVTDVTELSAAREAAEAAAQAKSAFLATMSHEIRTPMNGVLGMLEVLQHQGLSAAQRETLDAAEESARTLLHLIDEVLDFSKIDAGALQLERTEFALSALVGSVVQGFRAEARRRHLALASLIDPGSADRLLGDPTRLRQILVNLVGNALKFTERGRVQVEARAEPVGDGRVNLTLAVRDSGIGIAAEQLPRLFEPFAQGDDSITRRFGGTGLGLSIVRRLAQAMGGDVTVESTPGQGSTFVAQLLLEAAPLRESVAAPAAEAAALEPLAALHGRVLVVDDHPVNRRVLMQQLRLLGVAGVAAADGEEALAALGRERFDAVLCDIHMPRLDGYEVARRVRAMPGDAGVVPLLAVTADVRAGESERCLAAGMDGYLAKPVSLAQLRAALARWLPLQAVPEAGTAAAAAATGADFDPARLHELFGDDDAAIDAALADFAASAERELAAADAAAAAGDSPAAAVAAHRLHGAAANVGAMRLAQAARGVERAAREGPVELSALAECRQHFDAARTAITSMRGQGRRAATADVQPPGTYM